MAEPIENLDVVIIGAGPSGVVAAMLLWQKGYRIRVLERQHFPRFSIGESLLPQCMVYLEEAGLADVVNNAGFRLKNGAAFGWGERYTWFNFEEKFTQGPGTTFQVERATFDKLLADEAIRNGVDIRFGQTITAYEQTETGSRVTARADDGSVTQLDCRFVLDASGFGRVLPSLLDLETPSNFPVRQALFTHVLDGIDGEALDRDKILITVHPKERDIWYWLIPLTDKKCSTGVIISQEKLDLRKGENPKELLLELIAEAPEYQKLFANAEWPMEVKQYGGSSRNVKQLATDRYALLGNAGEFLDPIFSSGITIAMRSASTAVATLTRQLEGETVDWHKDYDLPLRQGVDTFRVFVEAWYEGLFQDIIFFDQRGSSVRDMISSILAGYAWDMENPFVADPVRRMNTLAKFCRAEGV
ncbi:NAD(P)/FAD-dependent oxidoreductase [Gilvimarinus polysaccharolyticus]|uniref:NAD(P)/FAD-dependent oxidoreductase n=1 Tax=Gilvimarinus polysaccharolyticus TaxID=863921 RepID=UPI0006732612|nr:NAD(P)/FAD-dependent oxidoreductase [Gilvimarinus polysaccharolyticus]